MRVKISAPAASGSRRAEDHVNGEKMTIKELEQFADHVLSPCEIEMQSRGIEVEYDS